MENDFKGWLSLVVVVGLGNVALRELIVNNEELIVKEDFPPLCYGKSIERGACLSIAE